MLWKIRDDLQKNCSLPEIREMLEDNGLSSQGGECSVSEQHNEQPEFISFPVTEMSVRELIQNVLY